MMIRLIAATDADIPVPGHRWTDAVKIALLGMLVAGFLLPATATTETIRVGTGAQDEGLSLRSQSAFEVEIHYGMTEFRLDPVEIDGQTYQKVSLPNVFLPADAGVPDLPGMGRFVALPQGAAANLELISSRTVVYRDIAVAPAPVIPRETDPGPLVYSMDPGIYGQDALYPQDPIRISEAGKLRGVDVVRVGITPFQYNPQSRELTVYTELDFRIRFEGGNGHFGEDRLRNRYWEPILHAHIMNAASLSPVDFNRPRGDREGYEYVIVAPDDPDFIAWADTLKNWRRLQGVYTEVFTTTEIGGTSATVIENWLDNAYENWSMPPVAFLILGDYPNSGLRETGVTAPTWSSYCVSDNIYADVDGDDLPDMVHGRITARDPEDLQIMIGKMMDYERLPPTDPGFYDNPVFAGGWQTERWFILCLEICLGHQVHVLGKNPVREYAIYDGVPGSVWSSNQNTYMLVDYFGPNGLGYIPSTPEHLTDWGANAFRLNNDLNRGAYLLLHRDHGAETGWGEPNYGIGDLAGLENEVLPFVMSMNCLTGKYNWGSQCFTEAFHRMTQGALGLIAASEISYSFVNDTYVFGIFDTMWPEFMPDYGPFEPINHFATDLRPAFGMVGGKYFLESSNWPYNPSEKTVTYHLFHHHGDAFLTIYSEVPHELTVDHDEICLLGLDQFSVQADAGAFIALTVDGEIIGTADATGYMQDVTIIPQSEPGTLHVTVTKANAYRYHDEVPIIPPEGPYLTFEGCVVLDDQGDADGSLDWSEEAALEVTLENVGLESTANVNATLSTDDELVTILTDASAYPDIPAGGFGTCFDPYQVQVSGAAPDGHVVQFHLAAQSNDGQWEDDFQLTIQAPVLVAGSVMVDDSEPLGDGNGVADPNESVLISLRLSNDGHSASGALTATLSTWSLHVQIEDAEAECAPIAEGGQGVMGTWQVAIRPTCPAPIPIPFDVHIEGPNGFQDQLQFTLDVGGWFDNVESDRGWALYASDDNAGTGRWIRAEPIGTQYNGSQVQPEYDHTADPGQICFVTGNGSVGGQAGEQDVDGGKTTLLTPVFELANATSAVVSYWRWYTNNLGNNPDQDYWDVDVTSDGENWVHLEHTMESANSWNTYSFDLMQHVTMTNQVQLRFVAADEGGGSLVEAAVDDFTLLATFGGSIATPGLVPALSSGFVSVTPNPFNPRAKIVFRCAAKSKVELSLYDVNGRRVRSLVDGVLEPGLHEIHFDGSNDQGHDIASGIYFMRLKTPEVLQIRQIALLK